MNRFTSTVNVCGRPFCAGGAAAWLLVMLAAAGAAAGGERGDHVAAQSAASRVRRNLNGRRGDCAPPCPLHPTADVELSPGIHLFTTIDVPAGVTVRAPGRLLLYSDGEVTVAGTLQADCGSLEVHAQGNVTITGVLDNRCAGEGEPGDLVIHTEGGHPIVIGAPGAPVPLLSSGGLDISNDSTIEAWEFDVPPFQRSSSPVAPVCSALASPVAEPGIEGIPLVVRFLGAGADPDGGPVTYSWAFGDGGSSSEAEPEHDFAPGAGYDVTLTVADDEGATCVAEARVSNGAGEVGVTMRPTLLAVAAGQPLPLTAFTSQELALTWDLGDGTQDAGEQVLHAYSTPGRYEIAVEAAGGPARASGAVWVYASPPAPSPVPRRASRADIDSLLGSVYVSAEQRPARSPTGDGSDTSIKAYFDIEVEAGSILLAQPGSDAPASSGAVFVRGIAGGAGGFLSLLARRDIVIGAGAELAAGDGGRGGDATVTSPSGVDAMVLGGPGGLGGALTLVSSTPVPLGAPGARTLLRGGNGGRGGDATALVEDDARTGCLAPAPQGSLATAHGGAGGHAVGIFTVPLPTSGGNVLLQGASGGDGGDARPTGGSGSDSSCLEGAEGGPGGRSSALGGNGGWSLPSPALGLPVDPDAYSGGDGGFADATAGRGGNAASAPAESCAAAFAKGGLGGPALAKGGKGGLANLLIAGALKGSDPGAIATGGNGGAADATGTACSACGQGGGATASGGNGGDANAWRGFEAGGAGGNAAATGGEGGDCTACPDGKGGEGGFAWATGGNGGGGSGGPATVALGTAGTATGQGGDAGDGGSCCGPPALPGGAGGDGGPALAVPGGGRVGPAVSSTGGTGGDGGDGSGPGAGGAGGAAITKGADGAPGDPCPPLEVGAVRIPVADTFEQSPNGFRRTAGGSWLISSGDVTRVPGQAPQQNVAGVAALAVPGSARQVRLANIEPYDLLELADGSAIVAGRTLTTFRGWLGRLLADGTLAWQQTIGQADNFRRIAPIDATTIVALARNVADSQVLVTRVSTAGTVLAMTKLASPAQSSVQAILGLTDGGWLLAFTVGFALPNDSIVIRFSAAGAIAWQQRFTGVSLGSLLEGSGDLFMVGSYRPPAGSVNDGWIARLAANGSLIWQRTYGASGSVAFNRLLAGPAGLIAFARVNPGSVLQLIQLAADGTVQAIHGYGANGIPLGAGLTEDGGVAMGSHSFANGYTSIVTAPGLTLPGCSDPALGAVIAAGTISTAPAASTVSTPGITTSAVAGSTATTAASPVTGTRTPTDLCAGP